MPEFRLRRASADQMDRDTYDVVLRLEDGFDLIAGTIRQQTGAAMRVFWAWAAPGANGQTATREEAMAAFRTAWEAVSPAQIAEDRFQQEATANKYALWDAGYRKELGKGPIRCRCGQMFDPDIHAETMAHIGHITAGTETRRRA